MSSLIRKQINSNDSLDKIIYKDLMKRTSPTAQLDDYLKKMQRKPPIRMKEPQQQIHPNLMQHMQQFPMGG